MVRAGVKSADSQTADGCAPIVRVHRGAVLDRAAGARIEPTRAAATGVAAASGTLILEAPTGLRWRAPSGDIGRMPFWVAQIQAARENFAVHCLTLASYEVYAPHVRAQGSRRVVPLFPSYLFLAVSPRGWWAACWSPGVVRLVRNGSGEEPALVGDAVVDELRAREPQWSDRFAAAAAGRRQVSARRSGEDRKRAAQRSSWFGSRHARA